MRRIWYVFIILLCSLNASWSLAAQETLFESVQELDGQPGTSKGADWRLTDFANFALQNDNNDELYGHKVVSGSVTGDTLTLVLADASTILVDVATLLDNTDAQTVTAFNLNSSTNILTLTLSGGNTSTVDLSGLVGTDGLIDAPSDGAVYGRKDGAWVAVEPLKGADDNYVTDAEKTVLGNTSGTNTGDQDLSGKQDTLVSGTNIKTVNSTSILGPGDIAVTGSGITDGNAAGDLIEWDGDSWEPVTPDEVSFVEPLSYDDTLKEVSIDTTGLGGISHVASGNPDDGACNWNTADFILRCRTGATVYASAAMTLEATLDITAPTASSFATDSTGLQYSFTASETSTVDCTKLTATWANAGTVTDFTGTDSPCISSTPVYSDDTGTMAGAQGFLIDTATNESIAFSGLSIDNSLNETVASTIGSIVPDFSYDFEDGTTGDLTLNTPTGSTITVSDVEPLSGVYSAQIDINEAVTIVPYMSKSFTGTTDYATNFKFALSSNFRSVNTGGVVTLSRFYNGAATVSGLQLKWNGADMVLVLDESIVITRGVEHMITHRITSTNMYVYLDGELVYTSPDTTHSIPNSIRVGLVLGHSFNTGISAKFDDWGMGSYVE
jgi:hypothetical protein